MINQKGPFLIKRATSDFPYKNEGVGCQCQSTEIAY
jgi:hypothetical protein